MYKISKMVCASKTAFASKIALATILLGFLFVGGASLQAQEGSENGWFVSASPLIFGASKIETKTTITGGGGEVSAYRITLATVTPTKVPAQRLYRAEFCARLVVSASKKSVRISAVKSPTVTSPPPPVIVVFVSILLAPKIKGLAETNQPFSLPSCAWRLAPPTNRNPSRIVAKAIFDANAVFDAHTIFEILYIVIFKFELKFS